MESCSFADQSLAPRQQIAFARRFGEPEVHPIVNGSEEHPELVRVWKPAGESASFGTGWHTDNSFFPCPSLGSVLYGIVIPPYGGDTLFASMERAYDALSDGMKRLLEALVGVHSASRAYDPANVGEAKYRGEAPMSYRWSESIRDEVLHPVIRTHPDTGRKSVYVNPMFTLRIRGLAQRGERRAARLPVRPLREARLELPLPLDPGGGRALGQPLRVALRPRRLPRVRARDAPRDHRR